MRSPRMNQTRLLHKLGALQAPGTALRWPLSTWSGSPRLGRWSQATMTLKETNSKLTSRIWLPGLRCISLCAMAAIYAAPRLNGLGASVSSLFSLSRDAPIKAQSALMKGAPARVLSRPALPARASVVSAGGLCAGIRAEALLGSRAGLGAVLGPLHRPVPGEQGQRA